MNTRDFLNILHIAERLKDTPRHCTTSKRRVESVAEHSWRVALMASLLRNELPDVDIDKVVNMCLIHDLGECFTGDIPVFNKTDQDRDIEDALLDKVTKVTNMYEDIANTYIREADSNGFILRGGVAFLYRGIYLGNAMPTPASMIDDKTCTLRFITLY
jgi:putative hydrolase of HD superfamily